MSTLEGRISTDSANYIENICSPENLGFLTQGAGLGGLQGLAMAAGSCERQKVSLFHLFFATNIFLPYLLQCCQGPTSRIQRVSWNLHDHDRKKNMMQRWISMVKSTVWMSALCLFYYRQKQFNGCSNSVAPTILCPEQVMLSLV